MSLLEQYKETLRGKETVWCSNMALIYAFFSACAEIPTRLVASAGMTDGVKLSGHMFPESYIIEKKQWASIDIDSEQIFIKNNRGDFLNTLDIFFSKIADDGLFSGAAKSQQATSSGSKFSQNQSYYFGRDSTFVFYFPYANNHSLTSKISRYLIRPDFAFSLSDSNLKFYIKTFFLCFEIAVLLLLAPIIILKRRNRRDIT